MVWRSAPPTAPPAPSACKAVSDADLADTIGLGLTIEGGGFLADGYAVVPGPASQLSTGWPDLYIAATIRGAGLGDNTVGAWAVGYNEDAMFITGPIYPANTFAREFSDWGSGAESGSEADDLMKFLRQTDASKLAESCID